MFSNKWLLLAGWTGATAIAMALTVSLLPSLVVPGTRSELLFVGLVTGTLIGLAQQRASQDRFRFPKWWLPVSIMGWGLGISLLVYQQNCVGLGYPGCLTSPAYSNDATYMLVGAALGALIGAVVGAIQWLPSDVDVPDAKRKIATSAGYFGLGALILASAHRSDVGLFIAFGAGLGCVMGSAHWFFVRRRVAATERWVLSYGVGWAAAMVLMWLIGKLASDSDFGVGIVIVILGSTGAAAGLFVAGLHLLFERGRDAWTIRWLTANVLGWATAGLLVGMLATSRDGFVPSLDEIVVALGTVGGLVTGAYLFLIPSTTPAMESPS